MRRFIIKTTIFIVVGLLLLSFVDRRLPFYWGNGGLVAKMNQLKADNFNYDTYFVGSSRIYRHIIPFLFDSLNNGATRSFNLGYSGTKPPEIYHFLHHFIDKHGNNVKYIFVELGMIQGLADINRVTLRSKYYLDYDQYTTAVNACRSNKNYKTAWNYTLSYLSRIARMGMIVKSLTFNNESDYTASLGRRSDGYYGLEEEMKDKGNTDSTFIKRLNHFFSDTTALTKRYNNTLNEYKKGKSFFQPTPSNLQQLHRLIRQAEEKGIQLVVIRSPRNPGLLSLYNALESKNKLDMCDPVKYPEFYKTAYSFDVGHFNTEGSEIFTRALATDFQSLVK